MAKNVGGMKVNGGYYWNPKSLAVEVVPQEGGKLPGDAGTKYVKVPFLMLFAIVPVMGALFLMFLPFIGFALFAYAIGRKVGIFARRGAEDLAATMSPGMPLPGEAHFTGKPGEEKPAEGKTPAELEKLAKEIEEKRK
ncbi:MAG TPA: hypothetical protein VLU43_13350 [Anaeromyxobacteraceae bacterium]|nr:hypothetical protein [Anaeromyxobacteraceae bacterium]